MQPSASTALLRRRDFIGKNDYYAPPLRQDSIMSLALQGQDVFDVLGNMTTQFRDMSMQRLNRYRHNWSFYNGDHYLNPFDQDGEQKLAINYCDVIVDRSADWFIADGFKFTAAAGNEAVAEMLNDIWNYSEAERIMWQALQYGGITGDVFLYVTVEQTDIMGNPLPQDQWRVRITPLNPAWVFPFWNQKRPTEMAACLIQFPVHLQTGEAHLFSLYITPETFQSWFDSEPQGTGAQPNPFKRVNVIHIPHQKIANSVFGKGDIDMLFPLNTELNVTAQIIRRIIKYHAEPTTVIFGASVASMEKGAKKLWSNLPKDAKIENLQLQSDLKATYDWFQQIKRELAVKGEIPMFLMQGDELPRVSNASGVAIALLFQPIVSKTTRRRHHYAAGMIEVCKLCLIAERDIIGTDINILADKPEDIFNLDIEWTSPLPKDDQNELDMAMKKMSLGIWSQMESIRRCADVKNISRLTLELAADARAKLAMSLEVARATNMERPQFSAVFLSSPYLGQDMTDLAEECDAGVPPPVTAPVSMFQPPENKPGKSGDSSTAPAAKGNAADSKDDV